MSPDPFESNLFSTVLSWIFCLPVILIALLSPLLAMKRDTDVPRYLDTPRPFVAWILVCVILFSPYRYLVFLMVLALSYPVQSIPSLVSSIALLLYTPIVFALLLFIGLKLPFIVMGLILNSKGEDGPSVQKYLLASIAAPIIFVLASILFNAALPWAFKSVGWIEPSSLSR